MIQVQYFLEQILNNVSAFGLFAPFVFIPVFVLGTMLFFPTALLTLAAGALFGISVGFAVALISSLTAASAGFLAGRYLSRPWALNKLTSNKKMMALDHLVAQRGWKIVLLLRLSAIFPFTLLNYGLGLSKISFKHYFLASLIGSIPGTLLYIYLGSLAGKMVFERNQLQKSPLEWAMVALGFAATIGIGIYSASLVKKALKTS